MIWIELEDAFDLGNRLVHRGKNALHLRVDVAFIGDQAAGTVGQSIWEANLFDVVLEGVLNFFDELLVFAGGLFLLFLGDFLFLFGAEIDVALSDGFEALFWVLAKTG